MVELGKEGVEGNVVDGVKERVEEVVVEWNLTDVKWNFLLIILSNRPYIYLFIYGNTPFQKCLKCNSHWS